MRFPSFSHDWKIYTFDDIASYKKGPFGSALKKDLFVPKSKESVKVYEQQNAINKDCHLERYFISANYYEKMKSFTVYPGDTIVSCAGTIGELYTLPENADIGIINQALMIIRNNQAIILKDFLNIQFSRMIDEFSKTYSNGSAIKNIPPFSDLKRKKTYVPDKLEQEKIIKYISLLDQKITTQIKIIDDLVLQKKYIISSLLKSIQDNEKIMLKDILFDYNIKTTINNEYPVLSSTASGMYLQSDYFNKETSSDNTIGYKIVPRGYCTYRSMSDTGLFTFNMQNLVEKGIVSPAYPVFSSNDDYINEFIILYLNNSSYIKKQILELKSGGTRFALPFSTLCTLKIPKLDKEKQLSLIKTITAFERKIENEEMILKALHQQKNFLLNNMFI